MMNRRTLVKGSLTLGAGALLSAACSPPPASRPVSSQPRVAPEASTAPASWKVLVAYFSRAGENYYYGDRINLEVGNTEVVANMITSIITADVCRIQAADPYPASYDATVERNRREQENEARPAIAGRLPALETYDTVLFGSPIWNVRPPMIMRTFIDSVDLRGKTILPFVKKNLRRQRHWQHHRRLHTTLPRIDDRRRPRRARRRGSRRAHRCGGLAEKNRTGGQLTRRTAAVARAVRGSLTVVA
jgi:flavodoxin